MILHLITTLSLLGGASGTASLMSWIAWRRARRDRMTCSVSRTGICDVIKAFIDGNTRVALERERRLTRIETLKQLNSLPTGVSIVESVGLAAHFAIRAPEARHQDVSRRSGGEAP